MCIEFVFQALLPNNAEELDLGEVQKVVSQEQLAMDVETLKNSKQGALHRLSEGCGDQGFDCTEEHNDSAKPMNSRKNAARTTFMSVRV